MAAIGSIRKHSTILLIIVAVALLSFILGDFKKRGYGAKMEEKFIVVGKESLSHNQFVNAYNARKELVKERAGEGYSLSPEEDFQINEQMYNELVDSMLFAMQAKCLGITVTNDELRDLVAGPQPHPYVTRMFSRDGVNYDMQLARQFIDNIDQYRATDSGFVNYYMQVENAIEKETYNAKYLNLLSKAYYMPKAFARKMQEEMEWKADLEVVQLPYSHPLVSDDKITVTDEDIKKWYEANKYRFKQEQEYRAADYVIFNVQPSEADLIEIEENVAKMFEEFTQTDEPKLFVNRMVDSRFDSAYHKIGQLPPAIDTALFFAPVGSFVPPYIDGNMWTFAKLLAAETRPDSVNVSFLFIADEGLRQESRRKKEESELILDSAYRAAMSGMDFYAVAEKYSDFPITQMPDSGKFWLADGVNTGFFMGDDQPYFDTLHNFNTGNIIKREVMGGVFIFRINEKTAIERKIQVAIGKKEIAASTETIENIESAANNFANGTDDYKKFSDAVIKHNLDKRTFDRVEKMTYALPGTNAGGSRCRDIVKWIYDEKTKKGDVSTVYALENMYVIVVVKDIYEKGYQSLENEQVKGYAEAMAKRDKKAEILEEMLKKSLAENGSISKVAKKQDTEVDTFTVAFGDRNFYRFGPEGKVIGRVFAQKDAKTNVYKGDMGVYVVKISRFVPPVLDIESGDNDMYVQQNAMMYERNVSSNGTKILRKLYKIEDHRSEVF
jgi:peptidyl-prolyl cis-trans isomerase D